MAERYLRFFPLWGMAGRFRTRDAALWETQTLVENAQNLLGVLAGINRLYYTTFQFKRMRRFIGKMSIRPDNLAERVEALFRIDAEAAALEMEALVGEVIALVEAHLPAVNTAPVRGRLGWRQSPW